VIVSECDQLEMEAACSCMPGRAEGLAGPEREWWDLNDIIPGGHRTQDSRATFSEDQQEKFAVDANGVVQDQAKHDQALASIQQIRQQAVGKFEAIDFDSVPMLCKAKEIVHIKGFGGGMGSCYDEQILEKLKDCTLLAWDGDPYDEGGFTKIVPLFLKGHPDVKAVAFKLSYEVDSFKKEWMGVATQFPGRIIIVAVTLIPPTWEDANKVDVLKELEQAQDLPQWAAEYFLLGRTAMKATGSKSVISLGGGGISAREAEAGVKDGVLWVIYALSRGQDEKFPTLCNWARDQKDPAIQFVRGSDPDERRAFGP